MSNFPPQNPPQYSPQPPPPAKSNKKMFLYIGLGCLGLVVVGVVVIALIVGGVFYGLANSAAATTAKTFIEQSAAAKAELGEPISTTFVGGSVESNNGAGTATVVVSTSGPKGTGVSTVSLTSSGAENWQVTSAKLEGGPSGKPVTLK